MRRARAAKKEHGRKKAASKEGQRPSPYLALRGALSLQSSAPDVACLFSRKAERRD
eukprot:CAMPEP_0172609356 /NCGR_PEP_ID=MMETSP1068-20121228/29364_1 /TAXON_ID=35684 /ORGANISM="Pseudopedinella elastica, Strain CCMP716" /LENGTH=55 /DNA_ID=CAMNT_0013412851 /DNA_START=60 /DNA_END=227 /DNA_ORIENTATION=-